MKTTMFGNPMNGQNPKRSKILSFLGRNGFYVALFMCIVSMVTAGIIFSQNARDLQTMKELAIEEPAKVVPTVPTPPILITPTASAPVKDAPAASQKPQETQKPQDIQKDQDSLKPQDSQKSTQKEVPKKPSTPAKEQQNSVPASQNSVIPAKFDKIVKPATGDIIGTYSMETLAYSKTMEDWRVHNGIDIKGAVGDQVKCAADGVVEKIYTDSQMGITIVVSHGTNAKTLYSNLGSDKLVKLNDTVKQGQVISSIGSTAQLEIGEEPHLHFAVQIGGKFANPQDYFMK